MPVTVDELRLLAAELGEETGSAFAERSGVGVEELAEFVRFMNSATVKSKAFQGAPSVARFAMAVYVFQVGYTLAERHARRSLLDEAIAWCQERTGEHDEAISKEGGPLELGEIAGAAAAYENVAAYLRQLKETL